MCESFAGKYCQSLKLCSHTSSCGIKIIYITIHVKSGDNPCSSVVVLFTDIRRMNSQAVYAKNTGMIILGGGLIKHHICNANLMVS